MNLIKKVNWRFWLGIVISLTFITLLLYRVQLQEVLSTMRQANYLLVIPAICVYFVATYFRALRWRYIIRPIEQVAVSKLFIVVVIGYTANNLLPARLGEIIRAYYLARKSTVRDSTALATIAVERIYDGITLIAFGALAITILALGGMFREVNDFYQSKILFLGIGGAIVFGLALTFVIFSGSTSTRRLLMIILKLSPTKIRPTLERNLQWFIDGLNVVDSPRRHLGLFLWSCPIWLLESSVYLLIAYSFHINQEFESLNTLIWVMVLLTTTSNLATAIPSSIGGIGPFEIVAQQTLIVFGVSASLGAIYAGFLHLIALWLPITLVGLFILWHQNWSLKNIKFKSEYASNPAKEMDIHL